MRNWVAKARRQRSAGAVLSADELAELDDLRAECAQLRMERDLLKRSMAFWVRELERHEARLDRAVVKGHRCGLVAAGS